MRVYTVAVENAVAGHAARAQLPRKPRHRAPLRTQLLLNNMSNMDGFCHTTCGFTRLLLIGIPGFARTHKKRGHSLSTF